MARAGLFLTNLFDDYSGFASSGSLPELPKENVLTDLPGEMYRQAEGQDNYGSFEITASTDDLVYVNEGSGAVSTQVPDGWYTASGLATAIQTALNANGSLALTYTVSYSTAKRKFEFSASGTFILPNASSTAQNMLTILLGFDATNTSSAATHDADTERSSTQTWLRFSMPSGGGIAPNLIALMLESTGGNDTAASTLYNDVTIYAANSNYGTASADWAASAALTINVSDRPTESENTLQVGVTSNATTYRFWFIVWNHVDDKVSHMIGICRAMAAISSSTRTVREVQDHDLYVRTPARTLENQHPVRLQSEWRMTIELERWEAADYRAWMVEAKRYGRHKGMVFALNWTALLAATVNADDEADKGFLFYGTVREYSSDAYSGNESDYMSGQMSLGQLRP